MMYGQMTAGSWIYIGSQGIVQGTYETFVEAGRQHFGGDLAGPLDPDRGPRRHGRRAAAGRELRRRLVADHRMPADRASTSGCARATSTSRRSDLDDALARIARYTREGKAVSIGLLGNAAELLPELVQRARPAAQPDLVTDQTSAHDLVNGYLPAGWSVERWQRGAGRPVAARGAARGGGAAAARRTCRRCSTSRRWACRRSTTATTSARSRSTQA